MPRRAFPNIGFTRLPLDDLDALETSPSFSPIATQTSGIIKKNSSSSSSTSPSSSLTHRPQSTTLVISPTLIEMTGPYDPSVSPDDDIPYTKSASFNSKSKFYNGTIFQRLRDFLIAAPKLKERTIYFTPGEPIHSNPLKNTSNVIRNQKYHWYSFLPLFLYHEFKFFMNMYFLLVALSQFIPMLQVGFLFTYVAPLVFVLSITMIKESYDDIQRWRRDHEVNSAVYTRMNTTNRKWETIASGKLQVGDLLQLHSNMRIPADCILLRTSDKNGSVFIRTDQLDGETDWKLRNAVPCTQQLTNDHDLLDIEAHVTAEAPRKQIYDFVGVFNHMNPRSGELESDSLSLENTLWANTVLANGSIVALVIYTGSETRSALNANQPRNKVGLIDIELNRYSQLLFLITVLISAALTLLKGLHGIWYIYFFRFFILFSAIVPISMRVNLDLGRTLFCLMIMRDKEIEGTVVRTSTIPEELGRISYLFTDKTGTLTRNVMTFKVLQIEPSLIFNKQSLHLVSKYLAESFSTDPVPKPSETVSDSTTKKKSKFKNKRSHAKVDNVNLDHHIPLNELKQDELEDEWDSSARLESNGSPIGKDSPFSVTAALLPSSRLQSNGLRQLKHNTRHNRSHEDDDLEAQLGSPFSFKNRQNSDRISSGYTFANSSTQLLSSSLPNDMEKDIDDDENEEQKTAAEVTARLESEEASGEARERIRNLVRSLVSTLALCHNVTPVQEDGLWSYQAASPDEVALVKFSEEVGLKLVNRTQTHITLETPIGTKEEYEILNVFPFTSESKRMGIIVRSSNAREILFLVKGAEAVMKAKIRTSDWIEEEVDNLARLGLRTLVFASKSLSEAEYADFARRYHAAKVTLKDRDLQINNVIQSIEHDLTLLGLTGVEDRLQDGVKSTLETLRNAGVCIFMLTGDKAETAICIGISARLIDRNQVVFSLTATTVREAARQLDIFSTKVNTVLVIDGTSLQLLLDNYCTLFLELACNAPAVICCRCSPTQKAQIVTLVKHHTNKRVAAIGDGGNDVAMITAADIGLGLVGKEGKQASLAADFSLTQFSHVQRLMLWHGRNSYKRSARVSQFVIHRGLIISIIQAVFSAFFFYASISIYNGVLLVCYSTIYTMFPVFSLTFDEDVPVQLVNLYPELYKDLQKGRPLSPKTFWTWILKSVYQGSVIMVFAIVLFESNFLSIVTITYTCLLLSELSNVALEIHRWHWVMVVSQFISLITYIASLFILKSYFDITFILTTTFAYKIALITAISCLPLAIGKVLQSRYAPSTHIKVNM